MGKGLKRKNYYTPFWEYKILQLLRKVSVRVFTSQDSVSQPTLICPNDMNLYLGKIPILPCLSNGIHNSQDQKTLNVWWMVYDKVKKMQYRGRVE